MCLRAEDEITFGSLVEDLSKSTSQNIEEERVHEVLEHMRRGGLIAIDWRTQAIRRKAVIKEYVFGVVAVSENWPLIFDDWARASKAILDEYGKINIQFQNLVQQQRASNGKDG